MRWRFTAVCALSLMNCACSTAELWPPKALLSGVVVRPVHGRRQVARESTSVPLVRVQTYHELSACLDGYLRLDVINGRLALSDGVLERYVRGDMQAFGAGLSVAPWSKHLRFELGAELYHADFAVLTSVGKNTLRVGDSAYGWNLDAAIQGSVPLTCNLKLVGAVGYLLGNNWTDRVDLDFDGTYWFVGGRVSLGGEE